MRMVVSRRVRGNSAHARSHTSAAGLVSHPWEALRSEHGERCVDVERMDGPPKGLDDEDEEEAQAVVNTDMPETRARYNKRKAADRASAESVPTNLPDAQTNLPNAQKEPRGRWMTRVKLR